MMNMRNWLQQSAAIWCAVLTVMGSADAGENLAPLAKLQGNGEHLEMLTDGSKGGDGRDEWFVQGHHNVWGGIARPNVELGRV